MTRRYRLVRTGRTWSLLSDSPAAPGGVAIAGLDAEHARQAVERLRARGYEVTEE